METNIAHMEPAKEEADEAVASHDLLACPFCGGEASSSGVVRYQPKHEAWWKDGTRITKAYFCNCLTCGTTNKGLVGHQTPEAAVKHWNTRSLANADVRDRPA
jgi:hypothetical protein